MSLFYAKLDNSLISGPCISLTYHHIAVTLDTAHFGYRIIPRMPHTFIQCSTYVKEGVRVINRYSDDI